MGSQRFIVYGAGAVGGVVGARLFEHGSEVVLIARGAHREAIARHGLRVDSPDGVAVLPVPVVGGPGELEWREGDVVLLTVKSQDTVGVLDALAAVAPASIAIACVQNGVANERAALRRFAAVYSVVVQLPCTHLVPGVVVARSAPVTGSLDVGCHPAGLDERARLIAAAFTASRLVSEPRADVSRWKYAKLLRNTANAAHALFGPDPGAPEVERRAREEAVAALAAAGIDVVSDAEYDARHVTLITPRPVPGAPQGGGSSWQSLARGSGAIEADYLNGEIVLLGRMHGVPTPVNELLRRLAGEAARTRAAPGGLSEEEFLALLGDA